MSGSSIGGVVGGAIGFFIGGPAGAQVGWMLGSAVGGHLDPDVITGPRLNDAQAQTSNEGVPRPIVYGTTAIAGNLIQAGPLIERMKRQRQGKGGGPVQETYHYYRTYAIRICEAAPLGGEMQLRRVWRDDKLVYSAVAGDNIDADSHAFASKLRFYSGSETQLPDASLEAMPAAHGGGVGNVPAYRGTCYAVIVEDDVTERGGSIPQYRWEVTSNATVTQPPPGALVAGRLSEFVDADWPLADAETDYNLTGYIGTNGSGGATVTYSASTVQEIIDYFTRADYSTIQAGNTGGRAPTHYLGYSATTQASSVPSIGLTISGFGVSCTTPQPSVVNNQAVVLVYNDLVPTEFFDSITWPASCAIHPATVRANKRGAVGKLMPAGTGGQTNLFENCGGSSDFRGYYPLCIRVTRKRVGPRSGGPPGSVAIPDSPGYYAMPDGSVVPGSTYTQENGAFRVLTTSREAWDGSRTLVTTYEHGPAVISTDPNYNSKAFWDAAYAASGLPAGWTYDPNNNLATDYPDPVTSAWREVKNALPQVAAGSAPLGSIVSDICGRVGVTASQIDVAQLTDSVRGYALARQMPATEGIKPLQQAFFFDYPEWDRKLRGIKRGGASLWNITDDNLVYSDDDQDTRLQAIEFPRKFHLVAPDPEATYEPVKQTATRRTDSIKAQGEQTLELAVVFSRDEAAQVADKMLKIAWEEAAGKWERELPEEFSGICPSNPLTHDGKRWRVVRTELTDGTVKVEAVRDRASAYTSTASGTGGVLPTTPISSLRGPTIFAAMNLPRLRTSDSSSGIYIAVQGLLPGWVGCDVQMSADGGLTYQTILITDTQATIGLLSSAIGASGEPISVNLYAGGELQSVTVEQLAARHNAFAIDSEVGQFQTATETAARAYNLTGVSRGQLGSQSVAHASGSKFVILDGSVAFVPLDASLSGKTLRFRPVSIGTVAENNATYDVVFDPAFINAAVAEPYTNASGDPYTDGDGNIYYKVT